eukprot:g66326.t1
MAGLSYEEKVARCMKSFEGLKAMNEPDPKRLIDVPPAPNQDDIPLHIYDGRGRIRFNVPLVTAGGSYFNAKGKLKQTPEPKPEASDSDEASTEDARKDKAPASNPASTAKASSDSVDEADSAKKDESKKAEVDPHEDEDDESLPPPNRFDVTPYLRGLADGKGTVGLPDGATYEGECENGKRHGKGTFTATNGMEYEGEWNEDQMCGEGKMTFLDGTKEEGFWDPKQQNKWVRRRLKTREDVLLEKKFEEIERKKFQKEAQQAYETQKGQPQPSRLPSEMQKITIANWS